MKYSLNGREVIDVEVEFPDEQAVIIAAAFADDGSQLTDDQLDELCERHEEQLEEARFQNLVMRAESAYEGDR